MHYNETTTFIALLVTWLSLSLRSCSLFLFPQAMIAVRPWTPTPLTARVVGVVFTLPGLVGLGIALDKRFYIS